MEDGYFSISHYIMDTKRGDVSGLGLRGWRKSCIRLLLLMERQNVLFEGVAIAIGVEVEEENA